MTGPAGVTPAGVVWILGLPASGKSTLAAQVLETLRGWGWPAAAVDSDEVRRALTPQPDYSPRERELVYRAMAWGAERLSASGVVAVVAATAHRRRQREWAREICGRLHLVWARCPLAVCRARDPKGLFAAAAADPDNTLPGAGEPFEEPVGAEVVDTSRPVERGTVEALLGRLGYGPVTPG